MIVWWWTGDDGDKLVIVWWLTGDSGDDGDKLVIVWWWTGDKGVGNGVRPRIVVVSMVIFTFSFLRAYLHCWLNG